MSRRLTKIPQLLLEELSEREKLLWELLREREDFIAELKEEIGSLKTEKVQLSRSYTSARFEQDMLTGLSNRRVFERVMQSLNDNQLRRPVSFILLDLDEFKAINDSFGHQAGDELLVRVGNILQKQAAGLLSVARIGGDEFALIAPFDRGQAAALAEFLRMEIQEISIGERTLAASFGVATNHGVCDLQTTFQTADKALYASKGAGRNTTFTDERYAKELALTEQDELLVDFENRVRTYTERMISGLMHRARAMTGTLREAAERDALTGLYNRRHLDRILGREFEKAHHTRQDLSVALIDLDNFGAINKTFGFTSGDRVLATAAGAIASSVRANDWVARYGGEEFLVVMPGTPLEEAKGIGCRIVTTIRQAIAKSYDGDDIRMSGTVGISCLIHSDVRVEDLIARASDQVKLGKSLGKDQVN